MKKIIAIMTAALMFVMSTVVMAFSDISGHWAEENITKMSEQGYLDGYQDGTFKPDAVMTRAEFIKVLTKIYNVEQPDNSYKCWTDVSADEWYSPYAATGLLLPIYGDGGLYGIKFLERYEAAYALLLLHDIDIDYNSTTALDAPDYAFYSDDKDICAIISTAVDNGIVKGKDGGNLAPRDSLTRAELCTLLTRLLENQGMPSSDSMAVLNKTIAQRVNERIFDESHVPEHDDNLEQLVLELVNKERVAEGAKPLVWDDSLAEVAKMHSRDMAEHNFFEHTNLDGKSPFDRMREHGISYGAAAENIAAGQRSAEEVMQSWMNSDGHRRNIMNPEFEKLGVGIAYGGSYGIYWTQCFTD